MKIQRIEIISEIQPEERENGNTDVHLYLDNGCVYSLLVATPNNIYWSMDNEGVDYFFGTPPLFVKTLTKESVFRAIEALVQENCGRWLDVYGVLQTEPQ